MVDMTIRSERFVSWARQYDLTKGVKYTSLTAQCAYHVTSDAKYLSTKVLKYVLKYFLGTYLLVLN